MLALDVTNPESISAAIEASGPIDALVNNAGIGAMGAFEATPIATAREIFETNTFGVMAMTHAVLPGFRERRSGVVVNVTSSATLAPFPLVAVYTASKTAIEGFTASLALELEDFGVRAKLVEPGYGPTTSFTSNGQTRMDGLIPEPYAAFAQRVMAGVGERVPSRTSPTWPRPSGAPSTTTRGSCDSRRAPTPWRWRSPGEARRPRQSTCRRM